MNPKTLLIYDTKRGSTEMIASWIAEELGSVDLKRASEEVDVGSYDLIIVGTPVYNLRPLETVERFIERNLDALKKKKVVLFTVGLSKRLARFCLNKIESKYGIKLVTEAVFLGKLGFINRMDEKEVRNFARKIKETFYSKEEPSGTT
ncbi:MAG: flavodoxin domain-containing protein [Candidatus Baldrarchaeia archaeon]